MCKKGRRRHEYERIRIAGDGHAICVRGTDAVDRAARAAGRADGQPPRGEAAPPVPRNGHHRRNAGGGRKRTGAHRYAVSAHAGRIDRFIAQRGHSRAPQQHPHPTRRIPDDGARTVRARARKRARPPQPRSVGERNYSARRRYTAHRRRSADAGADRGG